MKKIIFPLFITFFSFLTVTAQPGGSSFKDQEVNSLNKLGTAFSSIIRFYVDETNNPKLVEDAIKAMLENLDPHSTYSNAEETRKLNEPLEANFDGIGIQFNMLLDTLYILQVIAGGPSEKVGLLAGDRIITVNDTLIAGVKMSNTDVIKLIRGKKGTTVRIKVKRYGSPDLLDFLIIRDHIPYYSIDASYMADANTGYIRLSRFSATTLEEFKTAVVNLQKKGMKNLILDLQENGGGYLHISYAIADQFLEKDKLICYTKGDKMRRSDAFSTNEGIFKEGKLVLIINEASASASEIVAGAIQDWDRGVIVGRRSFGKGLVQRAIDLPDSSMIRLTIARYYTPSGRNIQKPYEKGNSESYNLDISNRFYNGEFVNADSIHFPDSLKYSTLLSKRTVYGGGGIMPDIFVPLDTTRYTDYHSKLNRLGVINRFSMSYLDRNRQELNKKYTDIYSFKENFTITEEMLKELVALAEEYKIEFIEEQFNKAKSYISLQLKAYIASDLFASNEYFQIINERNDSYQQALQIINNDEQYNKILRGR